MTVSFIAIVSFHMVNWVFSIFNIFTYGKFEKYHKPSVLLSWVLSILNSIFVIFRDATRKLSQAFVHIVRSPKMCHKTYTSLTWASNRGSLEKNGLSQARNLKKSWHLSSENLVGYMIKQRILKCTQFFLCCYYSHATPTALKLLKENL